MQSRPASQVSGYRTCTPSAREREGSRGATGVDSVLVTPQVVVAVAVAFVISKYALGSGPKPPEPPPSKNEARGGKDGASASLTVACFGRSSRREPQLLSCP
jgi:hypothetical protein